MLLAESEEEMKKRITYNSLKSIFKNSLLSLSNLLCTIQCPVNGLVLFLIGNFDVRYNDFHLGVSVSNEQAGFGRKAR